MASALIEYGFRPSDRCLSPKLLASQRLGNRLQQYAEQVLLVDDSPFTLSSLCAFAFVVLRSVSDLSRGCVILIVVVRAPIKAESQSRHQSVRHSESSVSEQLLAAQPPVSIRVIELEYRFTQHCNIVWQLE